VWLAVGVDHVVVQVISAASDGWVPVLTGLSVWQFGKLVGVVRARGGEQTGAGRRWGLALEDRVLVVAVYYRTNLTLRQVALLFGISKSAAGRVVANGDGVVEELPVLGEPAGRYRRRHPPNRGSRQTGAGQPQRLPRLHRLRR
jgi:hypothetical protein